MQESLDLISRHGDSRPWSFADFVDGFSVTQFTMEWPKVLLHLSSHHSTGEILILWNKAFKVNVSRFHVNNIYHVFSYTYNKFQAWIVWRGMNDTSPYNIGLSKKDSPKPTDQSSFSPWNWLYQNVNTMLSDRPKYKIVELLIYYPIDVYIISHEYPWMEAS